MDIIDEMLTLHDASYWIDVVRDRTNELIKERLGSNEVDFEIDTFKLITKLQGFVSRLDHAADDLTKLKDNFYEKNSTPADMRK